MSNEKYVVSREYFNLSNQQDDKDKKEDHGCFINQKVNRWGVVTAVNGEGKITMIARKTIGRIGKGDQDEATRELALKTTEHRAPKFKEVGSGYYNTAASGSTYYHGDGKYIEIDDGLARTTESFKKENEYYKHEYTQSSVLTTWEFLHE